MSMTISVTVAEEVKPEVRFPCVTVSPLGQTIVWFSADIGFWEHGGKRVGCSIDGAMDPHNGKHVIAPKGTAAKLKLVSEDGTEFPRVMHFEHANTRWLALGATSGVRIYDADQLIELGKFENGDCITDGRPLPTGTTTTITIRDGEISCEFEPPKDWLPVSNDKGLSVVRTKKGIQLQRRHSGIISTIITTDLEADELEFAESAIARRRAELEQS